MKADKFSFYFILLVLNCLTYNHFARANGNLIPSPKYVSGRGAALGGAFISLADDAASGLFYNPATLGKIRRTEVEPINFSAYGNSALFGAAGTDLYKVTSLSSFAPTLQNHVGKMPGMGGSFFPNFGTPGFAFGVLIQSDLAAQANSDGSLTYRSRYLLIPTLGTGVRLADGVIRLGYSVQWVNQASGSPTLAAGANVGGYDQGLSQGSALSHNLGAALTIPIKFLPAFNVVVRNVLGSSFNSYSLISFQNHAGTVPNPDPMTIDASFSVQPKLGRGVSTNWVLQGRDLTNQSKSSMMGHLSVGIELVFLNHVFLRGGWGSGYPSLGFGLKSKTAELNLAWYSEEVGTQYHALQDTRVMLQYQLRFF